MRGSLTLLASSEANKSRARAGRLALGLAVLLALGGCYAGAAARTSGKLVHAGFDLDDFGPWVVVTGPGSLLLAGGNLLVGSVVPLGGGVDPREPEVKWFHAYPGPMRPASEVALLCHRERATWITGIRPASGGRWQPARYAKWHFPVCIEALPGTYEVEVHYFWRETEKDDEENVSRQAESTAPSTAIWRAEAGRVYLLTAEFGDPVPAQGTPPQRHIPRTRDLGTTWWGLEESDWTVRIAAVGDTSALAGPLAKERRQWMEYECRRDGC